MVSCEDRWHARGPVPPRRLPWTTTKQGVVLESSIYQTALREMRLQARPVLTFLNNLYPSDVEPEGVLERDVMTESSSKLIIQLPKDDSVFAVDLERKLELEDNKPANILFTKTVGEIKKVKTCVKALRSASYKRIGEYAFDYLVKQECRDE